jgi:hypothetical protein
MSLLKGAAFVTSLNVLIQVGHHMLTVRRLAGFARPLQRHKSAYFGIQLIGYVRHLWWQAVCDKVEICGRRSWCHPVGSCRAVEHMDHLIHECWIDLEDSQPLSEPRSPPLPPWPRDSTGQGHQWLPRITAMPLLRQ